MTLKEKFQGMPGRQREGNISPQRSTHRPAPKRRWEELHTSNLFLHLLHWVQPVLRDRQVSERDTCQRGRQTGGQRDRWVREMSGYLVAVSVSEGQGKVVFLQQVDVFTHLLKEQQASGTLLNTHTYTHARRHAHTLCGLHGDTLFY